MKKILLLAIPLILASCGSQTPAKDQTPPINETVSSEVVAPAEPTPEKPDTKQVKPAQTTTKTDTKNIKPDSKTDEMTEELDSIIDDMISGL